MDPAYLEAWLTHHSQNAHLLPPPSDDPAGRTFTQPPIGVPAAFPIEASRQPSARILASTVSVPAWPSGAMPAPLMGRRATHGATPISNQPTHSTNWNSAPKPESSCTAVDEPLDLSIKAKKQCAKPMDCFAPLDLTVNKTPNTNSVPAAEARMCAVTSTNYSFGLPAHSNLTRQSPATSSSYSDIYSRNSANITPVTSVTKLHCTYCGYQCDVQLTDKFEIHRSQHWPQQIHYFCIHCQKSFIDQSSLQEHLLSHSQLYQHVCSICNLAFLEQQLLVLHMADTHKKSQISPPTHAPPERAVLKVSSAPPLCLDHNRSVATPISLDARSSPLSNGGTSPTATSASVGVGQSPTFGQLLAKQFEAVISQQVPGTRAPTVSDLMFMKSEGTVSSRLPSTDTPPTSRPPNLMTLLDRVVENSLRAGTSGEPLDKPDLKFMVTFSDDEDAANEMKECDSTVMGGLGDVKSEAKTALVRRSPSNGAENLITSTDPPIINESDSTFKNREAT